jgi:hypothetical protein
MVSLGYGKHVWGVDAENTQGIIALGHASGTFAITAISWSKTGFALTLSRVSSGWIKRFVWFIIGSMNLFMGLTALIHFVTCKPLQKTRNPFIEGYCWPLKTINAIDISANGLFPSP